MNYHEDEGSTYVMSEWKPLRPAMTEQEVRSYLISGENPARSISEHVEDLVENERRKVSVIWAVILLFIIGVFVLLSINQHKEHIEYKRTHQMLQPDVDNR